MCIFRRSKEFFGYAGCYLGRLFVNINQDWLRRFAEWLLYRFSNGRAGALENKQVLVKAVMGCIIFYAGTAIRDQGLISRFCFMAVSICTWAQLLMGINPLRRHDSALPSIMCGTRQNHMIWIIGWVPVFLQSSIVIIMHEQHFGHAAITSNPAFVFLLLPSFVYNQESHEAVG